MTDDTFGSVISGDHGELIVNTGEPGDLRWQVSYRKYHVSPVIHSVVWLQVILITSFSHQKNLVTPR